MDCYLQQGKKAKLRNVFNNNMSTDLKLSKTQTSQTIQFGWFLGSSLSKLAGPLIKVAFRLTKNILAQLGITAAASAIDTEIQKTIHGSGTTTLVISNKQMNDIMKIIQTLEDSNILLRGVTKVLKNEAREQRGGFIETLVSTLWSTLLENLKELEEKIEKLIGQITQ